MPAVPSPADLALWAEGRRARTSVEHAEKLLRRSFPAIVVTLEMLGTEVSEALAEWVAAARISTVAAWVDRRATDRFIAAEWMRTTSAPNALAALIMEEQLSIRGGGVGSYLRSSKSSLASAIRLARSRVAFALVMHAGTVPFFRPVVLARSLGLAIDYLSSIVDDAGVEPELSERAAIELGKSIVAQARFTVVSEEQTRRAMQLLEGAIESGGSPVLRANYLEACLNLYHQSGDKGPLSQAVELMKESTIPVDDWGAWHLNCAEVWMALADRADTKVGRAGFLEKATQAMGLANQLDLDLPYEIKRAMLGAYLSVRTLAPFQSDLKFRGLRFPFGFRVRGELKSSSFLEVSKSVIAALRPSANRGQYAYRETLADIYSHLARSEPNRDRRAHYLSEAIRLRGPVGRKSALAGTRAIVAQAEDCFSLAANPVGRSLGLRAHGAALLIEELRRDLTISEPLILLAQEVETRGAIRDLSGLSEIAAAARTGDFATLYAVASRRALASPDMRQRGLGGRGSVVLVEDHSGVTGQTFVLKEMTQESHERDRARSRSLAASIEAEGLAARFGVIEQLTDVVTADGANVSVRRYSDGLSLRRALEIEPDSGNRALLETVEYLAFFHSRQPVEGDANWRREMIKKEVGRWLKQIMPTSERQAAFATLEEILSEVPAIARRDSHSLNWLVGDLGRIVAVDLDAIGCRPLGYELAQLTDDYPIFDPDNLRRRRALLDHYVDSLRKYGLPVEVDASREAYFASLAARAPRVLGDPVAGDSRRMHAYRLVQRVAEDASMPRARDFAVLVRDAWARKAGLISSSEMVVISERERRRLSRSMAYHLRHDPSAPLSKDGWIFAEDLAELLRTSGHRVSAEQLLMVAGAMGEPRFELDGTEIRAAYGHTLPVTINYSARNPPKYLYHATPFSSLASIFEARSGLKPMSRQMVHLSEEARVPERWVRGEEPRVILRIDARGIRGLVHAASTTWLAPRVEPDIISIQTPRDVFAVVAEGESD